MDTEPSNCLVCNAEMPKARIHYGGISCYCCRAFFRRTTQKDNLRKCKFERKCNIENQERKCCPPCRYEKCLRIGMRPDLVLDENEKKQRFRKLKESAIESDESEEEDDEVQIVQDMLQYKRTGTNIGEGTERKYTRSSHWSKPGPSTSKQLFGILPWSMQKSSDSDDDLQFPMPSENLCSSESDDLAKNMNLLDPETGLGLEIIDQEKSSCLTSVVKSPLRGKGFPPPEEDQLMKYTHKKFRKVHSDQSLNIDENCVVQKSRITKVVNKTTEERPVDRANLRAIRKSVIVRRNTLEPKLKLKNHVKEIRGAAENPDISLNVDEIENIFTVEEGNYLKISFHRFKQKWHQFSFGEELLSELTQFSETRQILATKFSILINSQLRCLGG